MIGAFTRRFVHRSGRLQLAAAGILLGVVGVGLVIAPFVDAPPTSLEGVGLTAPFGRDHLGRNVLLRLIAGSGAVAFPFVWALGTVGLWAVGSMAISWRGGVARTAIGAMVGVLSAIPRFVWVLLAVSVYGRGPMVLGIAGGLAFAPAVHALLDERIHGWRRDEAVLADLAHGLSVPRVLVGRLVFWDCGPGLIRAGFGLLAFTAVLEATLSYLGFPGQVGASWGDAITFDFGRTDTSLVARLAPIATLWGTCVLALVAAADRR